MDRGVMEGRKKWSNKLRYTCTRAHQGTDNDKQGEKSDTDISKEDELGKDSLHMAAGRQQNVITIGRVIKVFMSALVNLIMCRQCLEKCMKQ